MTDPGKAHPTASPKELRSFGFTFGVVAGIFSLALWWRGRETAAVSFLAAAAVFFLAGALAPGVLRAIHGPWMKLAEALGYINTRILLGLFFVVGVTPTGLLMRLSGKDPMSRTFKKKGAGSYWVKPTPHEDGPRHFDRQF